MNGGERGSDSVQEKLREVTKILLGLKRAIVAFSGGVDSTLLAKLALDALGDDGVLAVTADSPSLAREDLIETRRLARHLQLAHLVVQTNELEDPAYRANTSARCYACKRELFATLWSLAQARHYAVVLYGAIGDDQLTERPGQRAALAFGVQAPLQEAGLEKWEVRAIARQLGLPNWDRPQNACLASRIPHGTAVTEERLKQIEEAEAVLRAQGFRQIRVRHMGRHARIEVGSDEVARILESALASAIARQFAALGFDTVGVDRAGYRSGGADAAAEDDVPLTAIAHDERNNYESRVSSAV
ncbi:MAG: ATP-dependent sacrificial sulfur transferase LarE [Candidatus Omnitrophica bacterium]|nr:ATP-dependent sacrificial sulfur transferase LarE [Candidatus Omnitrophota bacterium]